MKAIKCSFSLMISVLILGHSNSRKVCNDPLNYYIPNSTDCWDNKDAESNVTEIVKRWNVHAEEHYLTTDDGYIILVVRVYKNITKTTPIILGHGQHHNSLMFVYNQDKCLTRVLIEAGYQVYLINYRGSRYSLGHVNKTTEDKSFWNVGIHEMGIYDLRKCLLFVNETTGQKSIYVGFTGGAAVAYIYKSMFLEEAPTLLKASIALAPLASMNKVNPFMSVIAESWELFLRPMAEFFFRGPALIRFEQEAQLCASSPLWWYICAVLINGLIAGINLEQIDPVYKPLQILLFEDSIPMGTVNHFVSIYKARVFQEVNHGPIGNMQKYGRVTPPPYRLSEVTVPVVVWGGRGDLLSTPENVEEIYNNFTKARCGMYFVNNSKWNSGDFIFGLDMKTLINIPILNKIEDFENGNPCNSFSLNSTGIPIPFV